MVSRSPVAMTIQQRADNAATQDPGKRFLISFRLEGCDNFITARKAARSEEHTSELQSLTNLVCRLLLEKKKKTEHSVRTPRTMPICHNFMRQSTSLLPTCIASPSPTDCRNRHIDVANSMTIS